LSRNNPNRETEAKQASRVKEGRRTQTSTRDKRFNPKFTSTKEATSTLRIPQKEGYHEDPLASPNHTKEDWCSPRKLHKGERKYKLSRMHHTKKALSG
jgi:hypothetical protein